MQQRKPPTVYDDEGGPAFPLQCDMTGGPGGKLFYYGMSLRDYFAGQAMAALITGDDSFDALYRAELAYKVADAMIRKRERKPE
jgi:hypothetical protein